MSETPTTFLFDHERLTVYQKALEFIEWVTPLLEELPRTIAANAQLDRASTSIALNIAEGNGKYSLPDRFKYFDIARGSAVECTACLDVLVRKKRCPKSTGEEGKAMLRPIVAMLIGLLKANGAGRMMTQTEDRMMEDAAPYGAALENEISFRTNDQDEDEDRNP